MDLEIGFETGTRLLVPLFFLLFEREQRERGGNRGWRGVRVCEGHEGVWWM
jgi:hypothetical protein